MSEAWRETYAALADFIARHPGIELSPHAIVIPAEVRPEFYRLFDQTRADFVRESFPAQLEQGLTLGRAWGALSQAITADLGLEAIDIHQNLKWFLQDPVNGLVRALYDALFDVLQGKGDLASFAQKGAELVAQDFRRYYGEGYQRWATVSLLRALAPDQLLQVPVQDTYNEATILDSGTVSGVTVARVPEPVPTKRLIFVQAPETAFLAPKIIVRSTRLQTFVSFRPDFYDPQWKTETLSAAQEWFSLQEIRKEHGRHGLWPDLALYMARDVRDLALVAEFYHIARPEVVVEIREGDDWYAREGLAAVWRHAAVLQPRRGSFVLCAAPVPEAALQELATQDETTPALHLLQVGYDVAQLAPVVAALAQHGVS